MIQDDFSPSICVVIAGGASGSFSSAFRLIRLSIRALNIGVSVKLTSNETMIAKDMVSAMLLKNLPGMLCMKATGRKITTRESVVAMTARPISLVAAIAAS